MRGIHWFLASLTLVLSATLCPLQSGDKAMDAMFVLKASESNMAEVALGNLALKNAENPKVREFAMHMIEDHTKSGEELTNIAKKNGLQVASELNKEHKNTTAKLSNIKGAEFDRQYMDGQVKSHQEAIKLFKSQAKGGQNADVRAFAEKSLPTIEKHLKMAQAVAAQVSGKQ